MPTSIFGDLSLVAAIVGALVPAPCAPPTMTAHRRTTAAMVRTPSTSDRLKRALNKAKILEVSDRKLAKNAGIALGTLQGWRATGNGTLTKMEPALLKMEAFLEREGLALETKRHRLQREAKI